MDPLLTPATSDAFDPATKNPINPPLIMIIPHGIVTQKSSMATALSLKWCFLRDGPVLNRYYVYIGD